jgi:hypothetical protein
MHARGTPHQKQRRKAVSVRRRSTHAWIMDGWILLSDRWTRDGGFVLAVGAGRQPCGAGRRGAPRHGTTTALVAAPLSAGRAGRSRGHARSASPVSDGSPRCEPQICTLYLVLVRADADATPKATFPLVTHRIHACMHASAV